MKFKMNDRDWEIKELSQEEIRQHFIDYKYDGEPVQGKYYGMTYMDEQTIYLDCDLHTNKKKKTLYHELMHCYKSCFICFYELNNQDEDFWCELSANSHDIIHEIVEDYFKGENNVKR